MFSNLTIPLTKVSLLRTSVASVAAILVLACSASTQKPALEAALKNDENGEETFEATLRTLDENPRYVDQFFQQALKHPRTLDRFLQSTSKGLENDDLARMTARRLAEQPNGLKQVMVATFDAVSDKPAALQAVAEAMRERPHIAALDHGPTGGAPCERRWRALMREVEKNADGRRAFLISVQENRYPMAALIVQDSKVTSSMLEAFGEAGLTNGKEGARATPRCPLIGRFGGQEVVTCSKPRGRPRI
ncbi:MAG: hypothetical protein QM767_26235 [Anaeromyxobacter sp.]